MLRRKAPRIASAEGTPDCAIEFLLSTRIEQAFDATKDGRKQIHSSVCHGRDSGGIWRTTRTFSGYSSFGGSSVWSTVEQICRGCPNTSTPTCAWDAGSDGRSVRVRCPGGSVKQAMNEH